MTTLIAKVASALSFAHLAGLPRSNAKAGSKAEDDKDKPDPEDDDKKGAKSDDDDKDYADDDAPDSSADSDDKDPEDDDKKGAKGKKAEDDKDDDEKMQAGARQERARCAAIFASPAAGQNVQLAAELAFNTELTAAQAVAVLEKAPAARQGHSDRSARNPRIGPNAGAKPDEKQALAARWDSHLQEAAGKAGRR
jgi:hypothetical protein